MKRSGENAENSAAAAGGPGVDRTAAAEDLGLPAPPFDTHDGGDPCRHGCTGRGESRAAGDGYRATTTTRTGDGAKRWREKWEDNARSSGRRKRASLQI
ncbi:hypothetical protein GCM10027612_10610 [Microbispora bryophytorum subsp. camponoti]